MEDIDIYEDVTVRKPEFMGIQKRMGSWLRKLKTKMKGVELLEGELLSSKNRLKDQLQKLLWPRYKKEHLQSTRNAESCVGTVLPQKCLLMIVLIMVFVLKDTIPGASIRNK